jgi:hypothetical protein
MISIKRKNLLDEPIIITAPNSLGRSCISSEDKGEN